MLKPRRKFEQYQDFISRGFNVREKFEGTPNINMPIKTVTFQVTDKCNLQCTYCYQINKGIRVMDFKTAKEFIDMLIKESYDEAKFTSLKTTAGIVFEFIGGEPLLEIELIDEISEYIRYKLISENHPWATRYMFSMISNGVEYFNPKVQEYLEKNRGKVCFGVSLDGCKPLHDMCRVFPDGTGSYDIAEAACLHYKEHFDREMLTKMTIAPENITWTFEAFKNLVDLDYIYIHGNCVYEKGWTINHAIIYYNQLKQIADYILENDLEYEIYFSQFDEYQCQPQSDNDNKNYCGSTGCMLSCDPDGNICPCIRFMKSSLGEQLGDFTIGHVRSGMGVEPQDKKNIEILDAITRRSQSTDECWHCPISSGCGWCTAYNYQETGTPDKRCTYICWMHRARSLANAYYWNKVYKKNNENRVKRVFLQKEYALQLITEDEYNMLIELANGEGEMTPEQLEEEFAKEFLDSKSRLDEEEDN